jgi:DNA mismatch repair ATPase MutS
MLLLSPERIRIVFEDDDLASARSTALSVVFRVTRQDAHRVFQASTDRETSGVTLVHSRRTAGVWFSTQQLDILSAQRRALKLDLARVEAQLVASLVHDYNVRARDKMRNIFSIIADLDVLSVFAQVTIRHTFVRATNQDDPRVLEVGGLRWPWDDARTTVQASALRLDDAYSLLAIHSAVDADATILGRLTLAVVLNQAGCFVPCTSARLPVFDAIFLRSGTIDDTLASESTFFLEMQHVRGILDHATPMSLVLMEELCRGTAPGA